jgi:sulfite reductase beta subunit-like hemoprotein
VKQASSPGDLLRNSIDLVPGDRLVIHFLNLKAGKSGAIPALCRNCESQNADFRSLLYNPCVARGGVYLLGLSELPTCPGLFSGSRARDGILSRMRIPGGIVNAQQCETIADLVDRYSIGYLQVTNRANLQIRNLSSAISPEVWQNLQELGLASRCIEVDPIRNIMASPTAGIDRQQLVDTRPLVKAWDNYLQTHPELAELSAKFSVGFDGGESVAIGTFRNDILLTAVESTDSEILLRLHLNGGDTGILIQQSQCILVLASLASVYLEYTKNCPLIERKKPRLRHLLADWGIENYLERVQQNLPFLWQFTSCTVFKNRQDACSTNTEFNCGVGILPAHFQNRQDACSTNSEFNCGVGILPAHFQNRQDGCSTNSEFNCGVGILPAHFQNRQDGCSTNSEFDCGAGILPAHFQNRQDGCSTNSEFNCGVGILPAHFQNRQDACSTNTEFNCGVGILPAHFQNRQDGCSTNSEFDCGVGILPAHFQNRQDGCSINSEFDCGAGILPAHFQNRQDGCSTNSEFDCGAGILPAHSISEKPIEHYQHLGIHPQQQSGFSYIGIALPLGRLKSQQLRDFANLAQNFGTGILRLTPWQNLLISDIPNHRLDELKKSIARLGFHSSATNLDSCLVACVGSTGCASAMTDTQSDALAMVQDLAQKLKIDRPINIHFSGCQKSCAQHNPIDITLVGIQIKQGNQTIAGYDIYAGKTDSPFGRQIFQGVSVEEIADAIAQMLRVYQRFRSPDESLGEFIDRSAIKKLQQLLNPKKQNCK